MNTGSLQKLAELSLVIGSFQSRENIYDTVCRLAMETFDINLVWLGIAQDDDTFLPISGESPEEFCHHHIRFVYGFLDGNRDPTGLSIIQLDEEGVEKLLYPDEHQLIMDQGVCWIIDDIEAHNRHPDWRAEALRLGFRAAIGAPLIGGAGDMLGVVHFYSKQKNFFTEEIISTIRIFTQLAASAIENRQLFDNLVKKVRQLEIAKEQTARSESHYSNLFATMRDVVIIADSSRIITDANQPALRTVFGYETNDLLGRSAAMLYADRAQFELAGKEVFSHQDADNGKLLEMQFRRKSGEVFDGELYAMKLRGEGDRSLANFGIVRDISARKRAVEELARSEAKFRGLSQEFNGLLDAIPDSLMLVDRQLSVLWTNHRTAETIPGHPGPIAQCFDSGSPQSAIVTGEDGRIFDIRVVPLADEEGRVAKVIQVKRDITEQKQLEEQYLHAQRMESVGRLAGGVAHDFNNMLGVILGYTEMVLAKTDRNDPRHNDLKEVLGAGKRSADIVRQLLAFSRKQKVLHSILDLNGTIDGILKMLRRLIGEDIDLTWRPSADRLTIMGDPSQIDQILANLCVNARDAISGAGNLAIQTSPALFDDGYCASHVGAVPGEYAVIEVTDDGCGLTKEVRDKMFEPFYTTKEAGRGTGLGLATVYGIVKQNQGYIDVVSRPGEGTTFKVYLPRYEDKVIAAVDDSKISAPSGRGEMILVVEDEEAILRLTGEMLKRQGYRVLLANTTQQARILAEKHLGGIDLLFTDVIMPDMNGRELAQVLLASHPNLKCLFMSGYTASIIADQGVLDDGTNFLRKPFSAVDLAVKVREVLAP